MTMTTTEADKILSANFAPWVLELGLTVQALGDDRATLRLPWSAALAVPGTRLFLYGKSSPRPGRKMGHLAAVGATPGEALARAQSAFARLGV